MRVVRVKHGGIDYFGHLYDDDTVRLWTDAPWSGGEQTDRFLPFRRVELLPPVTPSKIICVGRNYRAHAEELGNEVPTEPLIFMKPPSALIASGSTIFIPPQSERVEHEAELAVIIHREARRVDARSATDHIFGYTAVNDVTARDLQIKDGRFTRGKGFDTFCPCGPWIETDFDPTDVGVQLHLNGEVRQDGRSSSMIFPVATLVAFISDIMTLRPGDLICTGTPSGVSRIAPGDDIRVSVEGLGILHNTVEAEMPTDR
jgi:2-keto-4-pentenoate hydratase/2-oxohepta-3-ene-1,7-dioic acid hydratase in catechol pathway